MSIEEQMRKKRKKILSPKEASLLAARLRNKKEKIVFTNGCFDILHVGHSRYLSQAKSYGSTLLVALNGDQSVKRLKGQSRPLMPLKERMELVSSLEAVDFVTWFHADTPELLIKRIKPNILVKGGDWPVSKIIGANFVKSYGGFVKSLPYKKGISTTKIIEKIKRSKKISKV